MIEDKIVWCYITRVGISCHVLTHIHALNTNEPISAEPRTSGAKWGHLTMVPPSTWCLPRWGTMQDSSHLIYAKSWRGGNNIFRTQWLPLLSPNDPPITCYTHHMLPTNIRQRVPAHVDGPKNLARPPNSLQPIGIIFKRYYHFCYRLAR